MAKKKKTVDGQLYQIGKMKFLLVYDAGCRIFRLVRGNWVLVECADTKAAAFYYLLHSVAKVTDCSGPASEYLLSGRAPLGNIEGF